MKLGRVGLGAMGGALARQLVPHRTMTVRGRNPRAVETLVAIGAIAAGTLSQMVQECEAVFLCLPPSADVHEVIFGPAALAKRLSAGKLIVDHTSRVPAETNGFADI